MHMFLRLLKLPIKSSCFLFGARNTGKSTLVEAEYNHAIAFFIDLLDVEEEIRFSRDPNELYRIVTALTDNIKYVIIDEIQKIPKLLNVVQRLMKLKKWYFIMTGSSARKLKKGGANLLAGRAFVYHLFPLTSLELDNYFNLDDALRFGTLPEIYSYQTHEEKHLFLNAYAHTYLKEEIWGEQLIRELDPFRRFLEIAAQSNGKIINYLNIARDVGVDDKTIKSYYSILEDTLIGFYLESFHHSIRKQVNTKPKFYLFDTGVTRALNHLSMVPLVAQTSGYGDAFEHFIILECIRLASYHQKDFRFSYLRTSNDVEIDLIVERPNKPLLCIEIKSASIVTPIMINSFIRLTLDIKNSEAICLSQEKYPKKIDHVTVLPWLAGLKEYFT
ncbi:MAG: hypothetical protein A3F42_03595 [Gammaproteobacteria bacterium RIFCSPHIGHO2_12_FULL_37_34]|nr:MAG: hypothetical protein A3F42_03595 [Gammaproteobacteria bacterium RIFCSPHIGHO2_12_FULL_37_34]